LEYLALVFSSLAAIFCFTRLNAMQQKIDKKSQSTDDDQRMARILTLYDNIEGLMDSFEQYVEEVRQELERERGHMTELSRQAAVLYSKKAERENEEIETAESKSEPEKKQTGRTDKNAANETGKQKPKQSSRLTDSENKKLDGMTTKQHKVRFLMSRGFSLEEVARELNIGRGEVCLIADLDKT
jgi:Tfp pilus assembly protein PilP